MLKEVSEEDIDTVINFAWELSQNPKTTSYPLYKEKSEFKERLKESLIKENYKLLGYYENNKLVGVINFFFIKEEKYLQTTGIYIKSYYKEVMDELIEMLRREYSDYRALFGFTRENVNLNNYFIENDYDCIDSCLDMRLNTSNFSKIKDSDKIFIVKKEDFCEYTAFHNKYFSKSYWTSKRLENELGNWYIFIYKLNNKIEGSLFIKLCNDVSTEIFGIATSNLQQENEIKSALLSEGLERLFQDKTSIEETIFFIEDNESELNMVKEIGFNYYSSYRCYEVLLDEIRR